MYLFCYSDGAPAVMEVEKGIRCVIVCKEIDPEGWVDASGFRWKERVQMAGFVFAQGMGWGETDEVEIQRIKKKQGIRIVHPAEITMHQTLIIKVWEEIEDKYRRDLDTGKAVLEVVK